MDILLLEPVDDVFAKSDETLKAISEVSALLKAALMAAEAAGLGLVADIIGSASVQVFHAGLQSTAEPERLLLS